MGGVIRCRRVDGACASHPEAPPRQHVWVMNVCAAAAQTGHSPYRLVNI